MSSRKQVTPEGVPVAVLRDAARQRVLETSLRVAAGEIGMSHRGLEGFIKGARPHPQTIRKLTAWHLQRAAGGAVSVQDDLARVRVALEILVGHLPPERRERARDQLLVVLRSETDALKMPLPGWLHPSGIRV